MKNWNAIKAVGQDNWSLMMAIAEANPESDSGQKLLKLFPECFNGSKDQPVPLSILRDYAQLQQLRQYGSVTNSYIVCDVYRTKTSPSSLILPFIEVATDADISTLNKIPQAMKNLSPICYIGIKVRVEGIEYIVVQNENWVVCLTPAKYIDVDIEPFPQDTGWDQELKEKILADQTANEAE